MNKTVDEYVMSQKPASNSIAGRVQKTSVLRKLGLYAAAAVMAIGALVGSARHTHAVESENEPGINIPLQGNQHMGITSKGEIVVYGDGVGVTGGGSVVVPGNQDYKEEQRKNMQHVTKEESRRQAELRGQTEEQRRPTIEKFSGFEWQTGNFDFQFVAVNKNKLHLRCYRKNSSGCKLLNYYSLVNGNYTLEASIKTKGDYFDYGLVWEAYPFQYGFIVYNEFDESDKTVKSYFKLVAERGQGISQGPTLIKPLRRGQNKLKVVKSDDLVEFFVNEDKVGEWYNFLSRDNRGIKIGVKYASMYAEGNDIVVDKLSFKGYSYGN